MACFNTCIFRSEATALLLGCPSPIRSAWEEWECCLLCCTLLLAQTSTIAAQMYVLYSGTMGSMDLATLNSADMEQLLQGAGVGEMYEHLLFQAGGMEAAGVAGAQDVLLRLMEAPAALAALQASASAGQAQAPAAAEEQTAGQGGAPGSRTGRNSSEARRSQGRQQ